MKRNIIITAIMFICIIAPFVMDGVFHITSVFTYYEFGLIFGGLFVISLYEID